MSKINEIWEKMIKTELEQEDQLIAFCQAVTDPRALKPFRIIVFICMLIFFLSFIFTMNNIFLYLFFLTMGINIAVGSMAKHKNYLLAVTEKHLILIELSKTKYAQKFSFKEIHTNDESVSRFKKYLEIIPDTGETIKLMLIPDYPKGHRFSKDISTVNKILELLNKRNS